VVSPRAFRPFGALLCSPPARLSSSPLFPYTTLFRSHRSRRELEQPRVAAHLPQPHQRGQNRHARPVEAHLVDVLVDLLLRLLEQDRKSTRLNSSHVASSYAVFCLKKKD